MKKLPTIVSALLVSVLASHAFSQSGDFNQLAEAMQAEIGIEDVFEKEVPNDVDDFKAIQKRAREVAAKSVRATVGVQLGRAYASGVIVSQDGYVLTASHVAGRPNRQVRLTLHDGRRVSGRTLGMNPDVDGALIKITGKERWPFMPMADQNVTSKPGDWCIATGHPGGYEKGRAAPVRLGRVISVNDYTIRSDCPIEPGDSGGPLIDLRGYVIGVHSRIFDDATGNLHVPIGTYIRTWDKLKAGEISQLSPNSFFLARFDFDQDGQLSLQEVPEGPRREIYMRLADEFGFDVGKTHDLNELRERIGLDISKRPINPENLLGRMPFAAPRAEAALSKFNYTRGLSVLNVLRRVTDDASNSTVNVLVNGDDVAHGAVVDSEGWIVTKASEVETADPDTIISCQLADSRRFRALLVHIDRQNDLAWLKIDETELPAIQWSSDVPAVGDWVVTTGRGRTPLSVGVVSVSNRKVPSTPGFLGVGGSPSRREAYVATILDDSGASKSKLRVGDTITAVNDVKIDSFDGLKTQVGGFLAGNVIRLKVLRDGKEQLISVRLGHRPAINAVDVEMTGPLSDRRNGFPMALRHDTVLDPEECGGPLIDLNGKAVGINIARKQRTGSLAIPAETVKRLLVEAKQKLNTQIQEQAP